MKKILLCIVIFSLALFVANAQELTQIFKTDADGALAWFISTDNATRGLCVNPGTGNILVTNRTVGTNVHKLDPATGADSGNLDSTGVSGGTHVVSKIDATSDGVIYLCNLAVAAADFKIYRYASEGAVPTTAYTEAAAANRLGDEIAVTGTGTGTKILVTGWQYNKLAKFTTADGNTFTKTEVTPASPDFGFGGSAGYTNVAWDPNSTDYWAAKTTDPLTDGTIEKYNGLTDQGTGSLTRLAADSPGGSGPFNVKQIGTEIVVAFGPGNNNADGATNVYCTFYDATGAAHLYRTGSIEYAGGMKNNQNGTGDVSINATGRKVFVLLTNNSISGWNLPATGVQDWNLY